MSTLNCIRLGNPLLKQPAKVWTRTEILQPTTKQLLKDMEATMNAQDGVGIAAPQVNISKQLFLAQLPNPSNKYKFSSLPLTAFFNPQLEFIGNETVYLWEGCLSVPGLWGRVVRRKHMKITFLDENAKERKIRASGLISGILQHESDHVFGKLFVDRMSQTDIQKYLSYQDELLQYFQRNDECKEGTWEWIQ